MNTAVPAKCTFSSFRKSPGNPSCLPANLPVNIILNLPPVGALLAQPFPGPSLWSCGEWLRRCPRSCHPGAAWSPGFHLYLMHCHYFLPCTAHWPKHSLLLRSPVLPSESPVPCTSSSLLPAQPMQLDIGLNSLRPRRDQNLYLPQPNMWEGISFLLCLQKFTHSKSRVAGECIRRLCQKEGQDFGCNSMLSPSYRLAAELRPFLTWHIDHLGEQTCPPTKKSPGPKHPEHTQQISGNAQLFPIALHTLILSLKTLSRWRTFHYRM